MEELTKIVGNLNLDSAEITESVRIYCQYDLIETTVRLGFITLLLICLGVLLYKIINNYQTGKWKD